MFVEALDIVNVYQRGCQLVLLNSDGQLVDGAELGLDDDMGVTEDGEHSVVFVISLHLFQDSGNHGIIRGLRFLRSQISEGMRYTDESPVQTFREFDILVGLLLELPRVFDGGLEFLVEFTVYDSLVQLWMFLDI